jgi:TonB family protein
VPLEQVRTQVLLLHSEQSTLDNLSSGFTDRYTVHCATSGTEALNTLTETPIHVIISAKDLPGMSGVEALREAKKRSPDTIGILLTGHDDEDVEALVGEKEVFQIVRGGVSAEDVSKLVDNATQQMRLLALAESANDVAANPDEPAAEHIVMETSENGSTIISDGTGTVPVLDPKKISSAVASGSRTVDVLVLTKDEEFLATVRESSRGMHNIRYANTLAQAEEAIAKNKIGVAVVDAAMIGENVEKLTEHLRRKTSRLVNIVAGRRDDGEMLMDLINRGKVYRFLLKPVSPGRARLAVEASVKHHLEAPDSAFKIDGKVPAKPAPKPAAKPAAKPQPKAAPVAQEKAPQKPKANKSAAAPKATPAPRAKPTPQTGIAPASETDRLAGAFDEDEGGFAETMTGIVANIGDKFGGRKKDDVENTSAAMPPTMASDSAGGSPFSNPKILGAGAAAVAVIAVVGYFVFGGSDDQAVPGDIATTTAEAEQPLTDTASSNAALSDSALRDSMSGRMSAEDIEFALANAEAALLDGRSDDVAAELARVSVADPENARLPFLTAQLTQMQLRDSLDAARVAIRENRFEDASIAIASARALDIADNSEIEQVAADLATARGALQVEGTLAQAAARLEGGDLTSPANDNARYYYELALSNDPGNAVAEQGLTVVASKLVLQARTEIDANRFDSAAALLSDAREIDPNSAELAAASGALQDAETRVANEARRAEEARIAAAQQAEADRQAAAQRAADERAAEQRAAEQLAADQRAEEQRLVAAAAVAAAAAASDAPAAGAAGEGADAASAQNQGPAQAQVDGTANESESVAETFGPAPPTKAELQEQQVVVPISSLTRTRYVAPRYPRAAERRNLSGWVDVVFTVGTDGKTQDIEIRDTEQGDVFNSSALRAVERWEFMPVLENGTVIEVRAGVRLMFAFE